MIKGFDIHLSIVTNKGKARSKGVNGLRSRGRRIRRDEVALSHAELVIAPDHTRVATLHVRGNRSSKEGIKGLPNTHASKSSRRSTLFEDQIRQAFKPNNTSSNRGEQKLECGSVGQQTRWGGNAEVKVQLNKQNVFTR